jgi:hypothetical protein
MTAALDASERIELRRLLAKMTLPMLSENDAVSN